MNRPAYIAYTTIWHVNLRPERHASTLSSIADSFPTNYQRIIGRCKLLQPGMTIELLNEFPVRAKESFVSGERQSDIGAVQATGLAGRHLPGGNLTEVIFPLRANG